MIRLNLWVAISCVLAILWAWMIASGELLSQVVAFFALTPIILWSAQTAWRAWERVNRQEDQP